MRRATAGEARTLTGSALLAACLLTHGPAYAEPLDRKVLVRLGRSVLRVEAVNGSGRLAIGTGVAIGADRVVTSCHVTRDATSVTVVQGDTRTRVEAQAADVARDLCVLRVPALQGPAVPRASAQGLRQGQELVALGYTGGASLQISTGRVVALHRWQGSQVIQCSNGFTSGASGGGLFDASGALVGVLTFRLPGASAHYFAAPADWLPEPGAEFAPVQPLAGRAFWEQPPQAQPRFLRAAALEQAAQWRALAALAEGWSADDPSDAEPVYLLAAAQEGLGQYAAAIRGWRHSLDIDADYSRSWARLARLYHRTGRADDAQHAIASLTARDPALALEVSAELRAEPPER